MIIHLLTMIYRSLLGRFLIIQLLKLKIKYGIEDSHSQCTGRRTWKHYYCKSTKKTGNQKIK